MFAVHYINWFGQSDPDARLDFLNRDDAQRAFDAIAQDLRDGKYGDAVIEIALYDESIPEMLASSNA